MALRFRNGSQGMLGGLAGAWVMHRFRIAWDRRAAASPESGIFGFDEQADLESVARLCSLLKLPALQREEALFLALILHYGYGAVAGGVYSIAGDSWPLARAGRGLLFGVLLWLVGDEAAITVAGISNPLRKTASSHVSALLAHLLFGTVVHLSSDLVTKSTRDN